MPRYYLIQLVNKPQDQLTEQKRDELHRMKRNIYQDTIREVEQLLQEGCFQDIKEDVDDFILALQRRDLPAIRQGILKVPGFSMICDQTGLLDAEPTLLFLCHGTRR